MKVKLYTVAGYDKLTPQQKANICNGCGTKGLIGKIIPDSLWGLDITEPCNIHDHAYAVGETIEDKYEADRAFLNNLLRLIDAQDSWWLVRMLRTRSAVKYYNAVRDLGGVAFWRSKNSPENLVEVNSVEPVEKRQGQPA